MRSLEDKNNFLVYGGWSDLLLPLTNEEIGSIFRNIFNTLNDSPIEAIPTNALPTYNFIKAQVLKNNAHYYHTCDVHKECGKKGGRPPKPNGSLDNQMVSEKPNGLENNHLGHKIRYNKIGEDKIDSPPINQNNEVIKEYFRINSQPTTFHKARFSPHFSHAKSLLELCKSLEGAKETLSKAKKFFDVANCPSWTIAAVLRNYDTIMSVKLSDALDFKTEVY